MAIKKDDVLYATQKAQDVGLCQKGLRVIVVRAKEEHVDLISTIIQEGNPNWDTIKDGHYAYSKVGLERDVLPKYFVPEKLKSREITRSYQFRGRELKGKKCKILRTLEYCNQHLVEFEEDIGGGGADGTGKFGHCIIVPKSAL